MSSKLAIKLPQSECGNNTYPTGPMKPHITERQWACLTTVDNVIGLISAVHNALMYLQTQILYVLY